MSQFLQRGLLVIITHKTNTNICPTKQIRFTNEPIQFGFQKTSNKYDKTRAEHTWTHSSSSLSCIQGQTIYGKSMVVPRTHAYPADLYFRSFGAACVDTFWTCRAPADKQSSQAINPAIYISWVSLPYEASLIYISEVIYQISVSSPLRSPVCPWYHSADCEMDNQMDHLVYLQLLTKLSFYISTHIWCKKTNSSTYVELSIRTIFSRIWRARAANDITPPIDSWTIRWTIWCNRS